MGKSKAGKRLVAKLARNHSAELTDEDRRNVEQLLGPGAIRFRLDAPGTRLLFATLGQPKSQHPKDIGPDTSGKVGK